MKYTRIVKEELEKLENEFVDFLVVNGIVAEDWIAIKENEPLKADEIVNQFSDVVWEIILRSTDYLDKIESNVAYYFKCDLEEITMIKVTKIGTKTEHQKATKAYMKNREVELFEMIQNGCTISDGKIFLEISNT